jgi:hypothetical protein
MESSLSAPSEVRRTRNTWLPAFTPTTRARAADGGAWGRLEPSVSRLSEQAV